MTANSILPSYNRYLNGALLPSSSRRSFRPREKYLMILVFFTFGVVCFGGIFFLPEFKSVGVNPVYKVYRHMQRAGPELLIPAPPRADESSEKVGIFRHGMQDRFDPHRIGDKNKLLQKIKEDQELEKKVLERPEVDMNRASSSPATEAAKVSSESSVVAEAHEDGSDIIVTVPPLFSMHYPVVQDGADPDPVTRKRRDKVVEMTKLAWEGYVRFAWGSNELKPVTRRGHTGSVFGSAPLGATIVDGLDTLYIMGLKHEFELGRQWINDNLRLDNMNGEYSVFEINIRLIGGLLTCYSLTGDVMFRDKAKYIADKLLPAFHTPTGIPHALINFKTGESKNYGWASGRSSILSEYGTLHLEFAYLSDVTGNSVYREKVDNIRRFIQSMDKPKGLYPLYLNPKTGKWTQYHMSVGAMGDSFYEYLLKAWLQSNRADVEAKDMFNSAMEAAAQHMLQTSKSGLTYFAELKFDRVEHKMDHLTCFVGGLLALAATTLKDSHSARYLEWAESLTSTCHESYVRTTAGLGPESFRFTDTVEAKAIRQTEKSYYLRPEVIESYFYLWRITKNPKYREWGWEAVLALEKYCKTPNGYSGLRNVYLEDPGKDDVQQSFFLAETLKYLYLLFSDDSLLNLDEWVFNTEAHPLPIKGVNPYYRPFSAT